VLQREPDDIQVVRADSLSGLPSNSPVGSRMAIMMGGAIAKCMRAPEDQAAGDRRLRSEGTGRTVEL